MSFDKNVFINCPFDDEFRPLLRPLLFTVIYLGFAPRIALERLDSGEARFEKLCELIEQSRYAIHDLSRMSAKKAGDLFRLNMPFELGLDVGCSRFASGRCGTKECLILEAEKYRYQAAISDLSNSDIAVHGKEPYEVVVQVRNWLASRIAHGSVDGGSRIWTSFLEFMAANHEDLTACGHSRNEIANLPIDELIVRMHTWVGISVGEQP